MRLSVECNGCKATLTSHSSSTPPLTATNHTTKIIKKEKTKTKANQTDEPQRSSSYTFSKNQVEKASKKKNSLSSCFQEEDNASSLASNRSSNHSTYYTTTSSSSNISASLQKKEKQGKESKKVHRSGVAVVEHSNDLYGDFRRSMVEMVMSRRSVYNVRESNRLLNCYLSLNPPQHHHIILKAFSDLHLSNDISFGSRRN